LHRIVDIQEPLSVNSPPHSGGGTNDLVKIQLTNIEPASHGEKTKTELLGLQYFSPSWLNIDGINNNIIGLVNSCCIIIQLKAFAINRVSYFFIFLFYYYYFF
jgi:hypothetical protein